MDRPEIDRLPKVADVLGDTNAAFEALKMHDDATIGELSALLEHAGITRNNETIAELGKTLERAGLIFSEEKMTPALEAAMKQLTTSFDYDTYSKGIAAVAGSGFTSFWNEDPLQGLTDSTHRMLEQSLNVSRFPSYLEDTLRDFGGISKIWEDLVPDAHNPALTQLAADFSRLNMTTPALLQSLVGFDGFARVEDNAWLAKAMGLLTPDALRDFTRGIEENPYFRQLEQWRRESARLSHALNALHERAWLPPPTYRLIFAEISGTAPLDLDGIEEQFIQWLRDYLVDLLDDALEHLPETEWTKTAREALLVHQQGWYRSSIPTWIIAAQGIAREHAADPDFELFKKSEPHVKKKQLEAVSSGLVSAPLVQLICDISRHTTKDPVKPIPARATPMHATEPYATEENSLKLACLVIAIAYGLEPIVEVA